MKIDQANIHDGLRVLPINIMACRHMLVMMGNTYVQRLWCVWELCTLFSFVSVEHALKQLEVETLGEIHIEALGEFAFEKSHCFDPNEEKRLRSVIEAVGEDEFIDRIRNLGTQIVQHRRARGHRTPRLSLLSSLHSLQHGVSQVSRGVSTTISAFDMTSPRSGGGAGSGSSRSGGWGSPRRSPSVEI